MESGSLLAIFVGLVGLLVPATTTQCLLMADNFVVATKLSSHLPVHQQLRAVKIGLFSSIGTKLAIAPFASTLEHGCNLLLGGGVFLFFVGFMGLQEKELPFPKVGFWSTTIFFVVFDSVFGLDAVFAAVKFSNGNIWVLVTSILLSGLTLCFTKQMSSLVERKGVKVGANLMVCWLGIEMVLTSQFILALFPFCHFLVDAPEWATSGFGFALLGAPEAWIYFKQSGVKTSAHDAVQVKK